METDNVQEKIVELTDAMQQLLLEKNKRYGNAAIKPSNIFNKLDGAASIRVRLDDKLSRVKNSTDVYINDVSDIIGYCFLLLIAEGATKEDLLRQID